VIEKTDKLLQGELVCDDDDDDDSDMSVWVRRTQVGKVKRRKEREKEVSAIEDNGCLKNCCFKKCDNILLYAIVFIPFLLTLFHPTNTKPLFYPRCMICLHITTSTHIYIYSFYPQVLVHFLHSPIHTHCMLSIAPTTTTTLHYTVEWVTLTIY